MFVSHRTVIPSHIRHVKDLPQGLITAVVHLHQVGSSEAIVVLLLGYLRGQMLKPSFHVHLTNKTFLLSWGQFNSLQSHLK